MPLTAYRVRQEGSYYQFLERVRLGPFARTWQAAVLVAALAAGITLAVGEYRESPGYLARQAIAEGLKLEKSGDTTAAMTKYYQVSARFAGQADVLPAAEGVVRIVAASLKEPCGVDSPAVAGRVVTAVERLPATARTGRPSEELTRRLAACADQVGAATPTQARASLALLDLTLRLAAGEQAIKAQRQRAQLRLALADALLKAGRPLDALANYTMLGLATAPQAQAIIEGFDDAPSLWVDAEPDVRAWIEASRKTPALASQVELVQDRLEKAKRAAQADAALIGEGNEQRIASAAAKAPTNQELAVSLAAFRRARGDSAGCVAVLTRVNPPGRLTADAQRLLGTCLADASEIERADDVLAALLDQRLAPFQKSARDYNTAYEQMERRLDDESSLPPGDRQRIMAAPEAERSNLYRKWMDDTLAKDPRLIELRLEYLRHRAVVPAALTFGVVKLRRAEEAPPAQRRAHLEAAERAFLSIREEAEGAPEYHRGLGQVLFRLGKPKEGAKELDSLLARKDSDVTLSVAEAYRELGLESRAREIAEGLFTSAPDVASKLRAALSRAYLYEDHDDEELWLSRADQRLAVVKVKLAEARGHRLLDEGKWADADRAYAQAVAYYDQQAAHIPSAANNAGLSYGDRYNATGDIAYLRTAVTRLEAAGRLAPDDAIVQGNLADLLESLALASALQKWIKPRALHLSSYEANSLVASLVTGTLRDELLQTVMNDPAFVRQVEVTRLEQVLAPQKISPYSRQLRWLQWSGDEAGLLGLSTRANAIRWGDRPKGAAPKETDAAAAKREAANRARLKRNVERSQRRVEQAEKERHPGSLAVAQQLLAEDLESAVQDEVSPEAFAESVAWRRKAVANWPRAGLEADLSGALFQLAARRAAQSCVPLRDALRNEVAGKGLQMTVWDLATGPRSAEVVKALRAQPELAEAAELQRAAAQRRPGLHHWRLSQLSGDRELERHAQAAFVRKDLPLLLAITEKLSPGYAATAADLALLKAGANRKLPSI
jgi:hypothetical protein